MVVQGASVNPANGNQLAFGEVKLEANGRCFGLNQMQGPAHSRNIAGQETIIEVVHRDVQANSAEVIGYRLQGSGEQQGTQRVALLHTTARLHNPLIELQPGGLPITPRGPPAQTGKVGAECGQHNFTANSVEGVAEVKLEGHLLVGTLVPVIPCAGGVDGN